jgi:hypothetical protein
MRFTIWYVYINCTSILLCFLIIMFLGQNVCRRDGSGCAHIPISCRLQHKVDNFTRTANDIVNATIPPVRTFKLYCCPSGCSTLHSHGRACPCIDQACSCMLHVASPDLYRKCQYFICVYIKYHNHVLSQTILVTFK